MHNYITVGAAGQAKTGFKSRSKDYKFKEYEKMLGVPGSISVQVNG